ncbi:pilus assembly protein [Croceibacterium aestuarii]|uniref:pilus assembly protein n=1 Tax=Croceibacterium aestuarii TaxID=3064139 RepID=UPI00272DE114|nr:Tad domain-containing protein [Croceibacterium sp. D39]
MFGSGEFLRRLRRDTKGNTLVIAAAALIPLTALIGSALDLGVAYMTRSRLQNACDAGALAARQFMQGSNFNQSVDDEGHKFFQFNFPNGTAGVATPVFELVQDKNNSSQLIGTASASVPTSIMRIFGFTTIPLKVDCNATRDMGHNDIVLVLDVTGSMNDAPSGGGASKISRLRTGAMGLYRALDNDDGSVTRYGIVPYSHTVNVARSLKNKDILDNQTYVDGTYTYRYCDSNGYSYWNCQWKTSDAKPTAGLSNGNTKYTYNISFAHTGSKTVHISDSYWNNAHGFAAGNTEGFRTSGDGCIEERPSVGSTGTFQIWDYVTRADIDTVAGNAGNQEPLQYGRYDPFVQEGESQDGCPSEAVRLQEYDSEASFQSAINTATARVTGGTYHDIGMLWGTRFVSQTGYFAGNNRNQGDNVTEIDGVPVNMHIVFMTDGKLDTGGTLYSAYGVDDYSRRLGTSGTRNKRHIDRFHSTCDVAKQMGITVWVIALDVTDTDDIDDCATSADQFYTSDGNDLEKVFEKIGQGIGNLRLTR